MKYLLSILLVWSVTAKAEDAEVKPKYPQEGTYVGYMTFPGYGTYIPVTLDTLHDETTEKNPNLFAFLKMSMGGFGTHEYVTQFYKVPDYDFSDRLITLDSGFASNGPDVSIAKGEVSKDGKRIRGRVITNRGGTHVGYLTLTKLDNLKATKKHLFKEILRIEKRKNLKEEIKGLKIAALVEGRYQGTCDGKKLKVQLDTIRTGRASEGFTTPFAGMKIVGKIATDIGANRSVFHSEIHGAMYNFYQRKLKLPELSGGLCELSQDGINCSDKCVLRRTDIPGRVHQFPSKATNNWDLKTDKGANLADLHDRDIQGTYNGYVHLESTDVRERVIMRIKLSGKPSVALDGLSRPNVGPNTYIFTDGGKNSINFDFLATQFSIKRSNKLVFLSKNDPMIKIHSWTKEGIKGTWYTKVYGKVGRFELVKLKRGELLKNYGSTKSIGDCYYRRNSFKGNDSIKIVVSPREGNDSHSTYPFKIHGDFTSKRYTNIGSSFHYGPDSFRNGYYDPFSGRILFRSTTDGRTVSGIIHQNDSFTHLSLDIGGSTDRKRRKYLFMEDIGPGGFKRVDCSYLGKYR